MISASLQGDRNRIARYVGREYSFFDSILKGGTGSVRIVYVKGIRELDDVASLDTSLAFCNLQIYKEGFAIRLIKKDVGQILGIRFSELDKVVFITTPMRVRTRFRVVIRHRADVVLNCAGINTHFQVLQVCYKSFKNFMSTHFPKKIIDWELREIEDDDAGNLLNMISKVVG